jgi:ABC-type multidrug transport system fused ATPase/permease subunit
LLWPLRGYFRNVAGLLTIGSAAGIAMNTAIVLPAVLLGHAVDAVSAFRDGTADARAVTEAALLLIAGSIATELPRVGKRWWLGVARARITADLRADALAGVLAWPMRRLHTTPVGEVMARVIGDVDVVALGVGEVIVETWDTLLFSASLIVAMMLYSPTLGLLALAPVPIALLLSKAVGAAVGRRTVAARSANAALTSFVQEGLTGLRVLKVAGRGSAWAHRLDALAAAQAEAELSATRLSSVLAPIYATLTSAGVIPVIWYGGTQVAHGQLSTGDLVAFLALFARFTGRAFRIPQMANRVQAAAAALTRLAPLLPDTIDRDAEPDWASWRTNRVTGLRHRSPPPTRPPFHGPARVLLEDVAFAYPNATEPALDGVSLELPAGHLVAVTGPVGSGKSALARVVAGIYPADNGRITIGNPGSPVCELIGYVPQGHPVFSGTVAENVLLEDTQDSNTFGRLDAALNVAGLALDVAAMPAGTATQIGELGVRISGGQRQRVALARAIAAPAGRPGLLVLDDPFSALDLDTETRIIAALRESFGPSAPENRRATILLCSTRLAAFPEADRIVVLEHGRIAESGSHAELVASDGLYSRISRAQRRSHHASGLRS